MAYEDFPESKLSASGMKVIQADYSLPYCQVQKIQYAVKSGMPLHLNVIKPVQDDGSFEKFPLILYVQGSAWLPQNLESKLVQLGKFSERGFVVGIVEYRPSTVAPFPAQVKDAKTAYRYLVKHANNYNINPEQVVIWGDSSGGHTASMVGLTHTDSEFDDECPKAFPIEVKAVIDYYGPTDISKMNEEPSTCDHQKPDSPEGLLIGGLDVLDNHQLAQKANPINYIKKSRAIPPFIIFHGSKDRLVPFGQSIMLFNALKKAKKDVEFYKIKGADHGQAPFWSPTVIELVEKFIRKNI
ncbi:hypothetical protein RJ45_16410 [Photobacterium gaetbulicola]|uniref:BD-FAE-like domain-containing protein n=2 Tax=Photobacterium gaetbulicola TaxID=1295392 RepID=A0A0B9GVD0_9GAMM|nr:hypothetical protein RJ45_16410 [Photobacterium gaetbulicola]